MKTVYIATKNKGKMDEFKTFFATEEVGHRSGQIIKEINFGPERAYFLRLHESMIFFILFWLIPIIGWTFLLILFNSLIRCKRDIKALKGRLEALCELLENPELENML